MPFAIAQLDPALFDLQPDTDKLEDLAVVDAGDLADAIDGLAVQVTTTSAVDLQPGIDEIDAAQAPASEALEEMSGSPIEERHPDIDAHSPEVEQGLLDALHAIPGESWSDPPVPFEPPPPEEAPGFTPPELERPPLQPDPSSTPITVRIANLSRPEATDFLLGEIFEVRVTGPPGGQVTVHAWQDGADLGAYTWDAPLVDSLGRWAVTGDMYDGTQGTWVEEWTVNGVPAQSVLTFEVRANG